MDLFARLQYEIKNVGNGKSVLREFDKILLHWTLGCDQKGLMNLDLSVLLSFHLLFCLFFHISRCPEVFLKLELVSSEIQHGVRDPFAVVHDIASFQIFSFGQK